MTVAQDLARLYVTAREGKQDTAESLGFALFVAQRQGRDGGPAMTAATPNFMGRLGQTAVAEILGDYAALLDERHDLELEALGNHWLPAGSDVRRSDVERRLQLYGLIAVEAGRLMGVTT